MTVQWERVHVFISSTFNDMHAERDYLVKSVFPELAEWCEKRKLRLVDIDLRWGVTEQDATQNKNVVKVCLDRIDDCRPFFLCFLGQRRGWVPEVGDISADTFNEFPALREYAGKESVTEMEIRHALIEPLHKGRRVEKKPDDRYYQKADHAFFYLRKKFRPEQLPSDPPQLREIYTNEGLEKDADRSLADDQVEHWREVEIREKSGRPVRDYLASWDPEATSPELLIPLQCPSEEEGNIKRWRAQWGRVGVKVAGTDVEEDAAQTEKAREYNQRLIEGRLGDFLFNGEPLSQIIIQDLKRAIAARYPDHIEISEETDLQKEIDQQEQFLFVGSEGFIKRGADFEELDEYVKGESDQLFVLTAPAGLGKSTLLCNWVDQYRKEIADDSDQTVHFRFIGQSDRSTNVYSLLQFLLRELKEVHGKLEGVIPDDPQELRKAFPGLLKEAGSKGKTVIVIDALNQLESGLRNLRWLPYHLPKNVKLIVSFKVGEPPADELLERMLGKVVHSEVAPFENLDHRIQLVKTYLKQYLKQLDERHLQTLINLPAAANPLYLKVVLSELRVFGAFANLGEKIRADFGSTPISAFEGVLSRLETDPAYTVLDPEEVVPMLFGLLAHARQGLSVEELTTVFLDELGMEKTERHRKEVSDTLYHFLRQVRPFLAQRDGRHDLFFESLRIAARERYVAETDDEPSPKRVSREWHRPLAAYFDGLPTWFEVEDAEQVVPNTRKVAELPYHQAWGELGEELVSTLTSFQFLDAKVQALGPQALIDDYDEAGAAGYRGRDLTLVQGTLRLSAHILVRDANQLAGQLVGRLMAQEEPAIRSLVEQTKGWKGAPWLRPLTLTLTPAGGPLLRTLEGHTDEVQAVAVTPDGRRAISSSRHKIKVWDLEDGEELRTLETREELRTLAYTNDIIALAVTPDGRHAVSGSEDMSHRVWDLESGKLLSTLEPYTDEIWAVAVTPDGQHAVSGSADTTLKVWDLRSGEALRTLKGHTKPVTAVVVTPDGRRAASYSWDSTLKLWDLQSGKELRTMEGHTSGGMSRFMAVTPDGARAVSGLADGTIELWDLQSGEQLGTLEGHTTRIRAVAVTPDGTRAVSGSLDKTLKVWDLQSVEDESGAALTLEKHMEEVSAVAVTPDGTRAVSGSNDKTLRVWDLQSGKLLRTLEGHTDIVTAVAVTPDGTRAVSCSYDMSLRVWALESGEALHTLEGHTGWVTVVAVTPDGTRAVSGSDDKTLRVWDLESGELLGTMKGHTRELKAVAVSPDGQQAVSSSLDQTLKVWDLQSGELLRTLEGHTDQVTAVTVTPDGARAVSSSMDRTLRVWDLQSVEDVSGAALTLEGHTGVVWAVAVTPDGRRAVSGSGGYERGDDTLKVWDLESGKLLRTLEGHTDRVMAVAVTPDGRRAVSDSWDRSIRVWDLQRGAETAVLTVEGGIRARAVTPDGLTLVAGDAGGVVHILRLENVTPDPAIVTARRHRSGRLMVRCPLCMDSFEIEQSDLGGVVPCPDWGVPLRVNPFTVEVPETRAAMSERMGARTERETEPSRLTGHQDRVTAVAVTPDGRRVISGSHDDTIKVWDLESGEELRMWHSRAHVDSLALTPDENRVVSVAEDTSIAMIWIWDLWQGKLLRSLKGNHPVRKVVLTQDARRALIAQEGILRLWDVDENKDLFVIKVDIGVVSAVAIAPDGWTTMLGSEDGEVIVWDLERDAGEREILRVRCLKQVLAAAVTCEGRRAIYATEDCTIRVWDTEQRTELHALTEHSAPVVALALTSDSRLLASASQDGMLKVWNLERGELIKSFSEDGRFCSCAIAADGGTILAGDESGRIHILHIEGDGTLDILAPQAARTDKDDAPARADDLRSKGEKLFASGEYEGALDCFNRGLELHPDDLTLLDLRASVLLELGRYQEALGTMDYVLHNALATSRGELANMFGARGHALAGMGRYEDARDSYRQALIFRTDEREIWYMQGYVLSELGDYEAALDSLAHAQELEENEDTHLRICYCYANIGDYPRAEQEFRSMLERGSSNALVYHGLGLALMNLHDFGEACQWLRRFLREAQAEHQHLVADINKLVEAYCNH